MEEEIKALKAEIEEGRLYAEESLKESEDRFRTMFAATATGIATSTPQGRFLQANAAYCQMLGYTEDELRSCNFATLTHPDDIALNLKLRDEILAGVRDSFVMEKRYLKKNGDIVWTLHSVSAARVAKGEITMLIVVAENITERKQAEEQLLWKTALLEAQVNSALDGMLVVDSNGMKILQNQRMIDLWNIPADIAEEAEHRRRFAWIKSQIKNPDPQLFAEKVAYLYAHPDEISHDELELINGRYLDRYSTSVKGKDGKYYGRIWVYRDITERKHIERRFRRLVDSNVQGVILWNRKGEIIGGNDAFLKLTRYTREDLEAGRINWAAMTPPEYADLDQQALKEIAATGCCATYEKEWICKDGIRVPILLGSAIFEDNSDEGVCFVLDLTERKKLEQQFRQSQKMEAIGQLAGGIAHDFNNLLTVINGYADVLISSLHADDPAQRFLTFIKEAGEQSSALTNQLLAFSKNQFLSPKVINLNEVVHKVEKMLRRIIGEDVQLFTSLYPQLGSVMADQTQIEQILLNLAVNARDAMPQGGKLTIETKHMDLDEHYTKTHADVKPGSYVMLAVTDSGVGIPQEIRQHIFEPFFTTKGVGKGTGLGLSVIHGIVKQSEGYIEVYSEQGQGTCFKIYLPQIACSLLASAPAEDMNELPKGSETILLVEDETNVREFARHVLEGYGYIILVAGNAKEALRISRQHPTQIHLLLTDVVMPGMGGRALAEEIQPTRPEMKVLFMSGYTEDAVVRHGILHEEVNFLQKPYSPVALAQKVRELLK